MASASISDTKLCLIEEKDSQVVTPQSMEVSEEAPAADIDIVNQIESFKEEVLQEAIEIEKNKVVEKTDGLANQTENLLVTDHFEEAPKLIDTENISETTPDDSVADESCVENQWEDSETDSETSESEDEFMADGERVRKISRGFKQISNCKRFWKVSMLTS